MKEPGAKRGRVELDECRRAMEAFFAGDPAHGVSKLEETVRAPNILVAKAMSAGLKLGTGLDLGAFFAQKPLRRCVATQRRYEIPYEELSRGSAPGDLRPAGNGGLDLGRPVAVRASGDQEGALPARHGRPGCCREAHLLVRC